MKQVVNQNHNKNTKNNEQHFLLNQLCIIANKEMLFEIWNMQFCSAKPLFDDDSESYPF